MAMVYLFALCEPVTGNHKVKLNKLLQVESEKDKLAKIPRTYINLSYNAKRWKYAMQFSRWSKKAGLFIYALVNR